MLQLLWLISLFSHLSTSAQVKQLNQELFPDDFMFGTATAAYQIEGAWNESGKGENIWDRYTHEKREEIEDGSDGDIACDSYHKFQEDVELLVNMKVKFYRFSLSWSRILPTGLAYKINPDGIRYYSQLIDLLREKGIEPMITMFHWDTPQPLEDLGGFTNALSIRWFEDYARVLFEYFGPRVKYWITFNEPKQTCYEGYGGNNKAPGYNSAGIGDYICAHNLLKAHARVYHLYDEVYRDTQQGKIGISLDAVWQQPKTETKADQDAAKRMLDFLFAWYADPIFHPNGDYPPIMKEYIHARSMKEGFKKSRLPEFTQDEIEYIKGTSDFFGLNHYTTNLAEDVEEEPIGTPSLVKDARVKNSFHEDWPETSSDWFRVVPFGFRNILKWINNRYENVEIIVTENGYSDLGEIDDLERINYYKEYLSVLLDAIHVDKVKVTAYTAWSLLDNFEWKYGYKNRYGLHHVNFNDPERTRTPKTSVEFFRKVIEDNKLPAI